MGMMRSLARSVALANMEEKHGHFLRQNKKHIRVFAGYTQDGTFDKEKSGSVFAKVWRDFVPANRDKINAQRD